MATNVLSVMYDEGFCMQFDASLFQWLYSCAQQKRLSRDLYTFVVQFSLDVILVYLHAVYDNQTEVCRLSISDSVLYLCVVLCVEL